jgi:SAM-dependent methyltransferase
LIAGLDAPPGSERLPEFDRGWLIEDGERAPFLSYAAVDASVNWSDELEALHEDSTRDHFIDVWTRRAMLERLGPLPPAPTLLDLGCSTGYLLADLELAHPDATLIGVDLVGEGLRKAHELVPGVHLLRADVCRLPLSEESVDGIVSANLLEHVPDDVRALHEIARVLRPGGQAVIVVPAGRHLYDYYDRFLGHERRYTRGEIARKGRAAGLEPVEECHLGSVLYPAFWLVKQHNRRRWAGLEDDALERRVAGDIASTRKSRIGPLACALDRRMLAGGLRLPFGIRNLTVLRRC